MNPELDQTIRRQVAIARIRHFADELRAHAVNPELDQTIRRQVAMAGIRHFTDELRAHTVNPELDQTIRRDLSVSQTPDLPGEGERYVEEGVLQQMIVTHGVAQTRHLARVGGIASEGEEAGALRAF